AVQNVFVNLYNKGLIYRGRRMINWDPAAQTALSDEEVINKPQKGSLYYVRYEIVEERSASAPLATQEAQAGGLRAFIEVATTRPETIMADTGVAVHPRDNRYADLVGKHAWRPLARDKIPIIADDAIDPEFGTGALKVTPAHDKLDFEIGQRHNLPVVDVLTADGRINCLAEPELHGLDRFAARERAAELLQDRHLLAKSEPYENNVGFSDRSDVPIEPSISEQWFLHYPRTNEALAIVRDHLITFFPAYWEKVYGQWLENIQDWCISRQVWWGHRIPAWYWRDKSEIRNPKSEIYVGLEPPANPEKWRQDEDTLDTWFSSWLWAYETMDEETRRKFYPTSVLVTGPDIIFFWVARMIIAGLEFKPGKSTRDEDNIPFRHVYFTGIIRDKLGRKMSKSLGNSPDPLELIDKYGADGLRFGLMRIAPSGQDIWFDEKQIEQGRNFATKLWNVARFRQMHGATLISPIEKLDGFKPSSFGSMSIYAIEVLSRLNETIEAVEQGYREYAFNSVAQRLYDFVWSDYCDWFVEAAKTGIFGADEAKKNSALSVMDYVLSAVLRLLHPFMPHITEELWSLFGFGDGSIQFAEPPKPIALDELDVATARTRVSAIYSAVQAGRNLRAEAKIPSNKKARFVLRATDGDVSRESGTLERLLNAEQLTLDRQYQGVPGEPVAVTPLGEIFLTVGESDKEAERERLDREIERLETELRAAEEKLANASFVERAPATVVDEHRRRQKDISEQVAKLKQARLRLQ
ncbi:MAG TPA: valine--tRNA ligase, partial [Chthoniobacterales bacterium]|nr:valine--tRNA ligase [Chthoniobacterales bacterium]